MRFLSQNIRSRLFRIFSMTPCISYLSVIIQQCSPFSLHFTDNSQFRTKIFENAVNPSVNIAAPRSLWSDFVLKQLMNPNNSCPLMYLCVCGVTFRHLSCVLKCHVTCQFRLSLTISSISIYLLVSFLFSDVWRPEKIREYNLNHSFYTVYTVVSIFLQLFQ